jgi:regulator of replication initiation timing
MSNELFDALEKRIESLVEDYRALKETAFQLKEENERLVKERELFKERLDTIIRKLEGV